MSLFIQKYGGTSVGNLERIRSVAEHIAATYRQGHRLVVVVSAMGQQTDELLDMALALSPEPPQREVDMLLSVGERISMSLLAIALNNLKIATISLTGSQSGILTDDTHGNAKIQRILGDRIRKALDTGKLVIIAGFQGMSEAGKEITTLGRGGSDLTAIALAHTLKADRCQIYKDVDGVCSADPRLVPAARVMPTMSWDSLSHLTWYGSGVVHNRGVHLAKKYEIPLEIRSSFNLETPGTLVGGSKTVEKAVVHAITHRKDLTWIRLSGAKAETISPV
ncbi:MAG: aspartate kinase, partial [Pseudobdellovibrionaceae bacterium]|nr:aspartate kinase [Pseudobdellovibrionaceae bacterium]